MISLKQAVIVEGKYDKITLENLISSTIIQTNGFQIFKDKEKCDYIRFLAQRDGIIILTDSDYAGLQIRSYLKNICQNAKIINVYIPQLCGKEKRKSKAGKEGILGVEGMTLDVLEESFKKSGITEYEFAESLRRVTKNDLFILGLSGRQDSSKIRKELANYLGLPDNFSSNAFLDAVNAVYGYDKFIKAVEKWRQEADKK